MENSRLLDPVEAQMLALLILDTGISEYIVSEIRDLSMNSGTGIIL